MSYNKDITDWSIPDDYHQNSNNVDAPSEREAALGANIMVRPIINMLDQDEMTDAEGHAVLGQERSALDNQVDRAAIENEQRLNIERINSVTDGVIQQINENPDANAAYEKIRQRTLGTVYTMAGVQGEARTREDIQALIEAGVDFFIGQLRNQLRQDEIVTALKQKVFNLLLTLQTIYDRVVDSNKKVDKPLSSAELIRTLLRKLRACFIEFLRTSTFYRWIQRELIRHNNYQIILKYAFGAVAVAFVVYKFKNYFEKK